MKIDFYIYADCEEFHLVEGCGDKLLGVFSTEEEAIAAAIKTARNRKKHYVIHYMG